MATITFDANGYAMTSNGPAAPFSRAWSECYLELLNGRYADAQRLRRRCNIATGRPMRITIVVWDHRAQGEVDFCEVFGARAALVAIKALRQEWPGERFEVCASDTRMNGLIDAYLNEDR